MSLSRLRQKVSTLNFGSLRSKGTKSVSVPEKKSKFVEGFDDSKGSGLEGEESSLSDSRLRKYWRVTRFKSFESFKDSGMASAPELALTGKVVLVTGGTAGLGRATVVQLAKKNPDHIYFTGRSAARAEETKAAAKEVAPHVEVDFVSCDLTDYDSIGECACEIDASCSRLDVVVCNAGIMAVEPATSKAGLEIQFATNHMGHAVLLKHLIPKLERNSKIFGDARVVFLSSEGYAAAPKIGIDFDNLYSKQDKGVACKWFNYGQSKLANILYAQQLAKHHPSISTASIHPGVIATDLVNNLGFLNRMLVYVTTIGKMVTEEEGVKNSVWAATVPLGQLESGAFYLPVGQKNAGNTNTQNQKLAERLWSWTQIQMN